MTAPDRLAALDLLGRLARILEARTVWSRAFGARRLVAGFAEALREELDFPLLGYCLLVVAVVLVLRVLVVIFRRD